MAIYVYGLLISFSRCSKSFLSLKVALCFLLFLYNFCRFLRFPAPYPFPTCHLAHCCLSLKFTVYGRIAWLLPSSCACRLGQRFPTFRFRRLLFTPSGNLHRKRNLHSIKQTFHVVLTSAAAAALR